MIDHADSREKAGEKPDLARYNVTVQFHVMLLIEMIYYNLLGSRSDLSRGKRSGFGREVSVNLFPQFNPTLDNGL